MRAAGRFALRIGGAVLVMVLAGCSAAPFATAVAPKGPPWVTAASPDLVALRWYANQTPVIAAGDIAKAHCAAFGKTAVLVVDEESGSAQIAQYACR